MCLASRAYKRLCKLYRGVLRHMRVLQWLSEHGVRQMGVAEPILVVRSHSGRKGRAIERFQSMESVEPRILLSVTDGLVSDIPTAFNVASFSTSAGEFDVMVPGAVSDSIVQDDPTVSMGGSYTGTRGQVTDVLVSITDDAYRLASANFTFRYDTSVLDLSNSDVTLSSSFSSDWSMLANVSDAQGVAYVVIYTEGDPIGVNGPQDLLNLGFHVSSGAMAGTSSLVIDDAGSWLNDGRLALTTVDGSIIIPIGVTITPSAGNTNQEGSPLAFSSSTFGQSGSVSYLWTVTKDSAPYTVTDNTNSTFSFTPDDNATYVTTLAVTDTAGNSGTSAVTTNVANVAPTVTVTNATVTVNEAQAASNTGTFGDVGVDTVAITASVGTITQSAGTWSWSYTPSDGPDAGQTVTITATDSDGAFTTTTFALVVNNLPPTVAADEPVVTVDSGHVATNTGTWSDVPADLAGVTLTASTGTGTVTKNLDGTWTWSYTPTNSGITIVTETVTITATDDDGGASSTSFSLVVYARGDFNHDGIVNATDIDLLYANFGSNPSYDLSGDGTVTQADMDEMIHAILHTDYGDANLDGKIGFADFQVLLDNWQAEDLGWAGGDFNGDGYTNYRDFQKLLDNWNPLGVSQSLTVQPAADTRSSANVLVTNDVASTVAAVQPAGVIASSSNVQDVDTLLSADYPSVRKATPAAVTVFDATSVLGQPQVVQPAATDDSDNQNDEDALRVDGTPLDVLASADAIGQLQLELDGPVA